MFIRLLFLVLVSPCTQTFPQIPNNSERSLSPCTDEPCETLESAFSSLTPAEPRIIKLNEGDYSSPTTTISIPAGCSANMNGQDSKTTNLAISLTDTVFNVDSNGKLDITKLKFDYEPRDSQYGLLIKGSLATVSLTDVIISSSSKIRSNAGLISTSSLSLSAVTVKNFILLSGNSRYPLVSSDQNHGSLTAQDNCVFENIEGTVFLCTLDHDIILKDIHFVSCTITENSYYSLISLESRSSVSNDATLTLENLDFSQTAHTTAKAGSAFIQVSATAEYLYSRHSVWKEVLLAAPHTLGLFTAALERCITDEHRSECGGTSVNLFGYSETPVFVAPEGSDSHACDGVDDSHACSTVSHALTKAASLPDVDYSTVHIYPGVYSQKQIACSITRNTYLFGMTVITEALNILHTISFTVSATQANSPIITVEKGTNPSVEAILENIELYLYFTRPFQSNVIRVGLDCSLILNDVILINSAFLKSFISIVPDLSLLDVPGYSAKPIIDASAGKLTLCSAEFDAINLKNAPLLLVSTRAGAYSTEYRDNNFGMITRKGGNGAVLDLDFTNEANAVLSLKNSNFWACNCTAGNGGAAAIKFGSTAPSIESQSTRLMYCRAVLGNVFYFESGKADWSKEESQLAIWRSLVAAPDYDMTAVAVSEGGKTLTIGDLLIPTYYQRSSTAAASSCGAHDSPCPTLTACLSTSTFAKLPRIAVARGTHASETATTTFASRTSIYGQSSKAADTVLTLQSIGSEGDPFFLLDNAELHMADLTLSISSPFTNVVFKSTTDLKSRNNPMLFIHYVILTMTGNTALPYSVFGTNLDIYFFHSQVTSITMDNAPLISRNSYNNMEHICSVFQSIRRLHGNGAVIESSSYTCPRIFLDRSAAFIDCSVAAGNGGAISYDLNSISTDYGYSTSRPLRLGIATFTRCSAHKATDGTGGCGGAVYIVISDHSEPYDFGDMYIDCVRLTFTDCTAEAEGASVFVDTPTHTLPPLVVVARLLQTAPAKEGSMAYAHSKDGTVEYLSLYSLAPTTIYVSPTGIQYTADNQCGTADKPCKSLPDALKTYNAASSSIKMLEGTYDKMGSQDLSGYLTIESVRGKTTVQTVTTECGFNVKDYGDASVKYLRLVLQRSEIYTASVFKLGFMAKCTLVLCQINKMDALPGMHVNEENDDPILKESLVAAQIGALSLSGVDVSGLTLVSKPLLEVSSKPGAFEMSKEEDTVCSFANITRSTGSGAVLDIPVGETSDVQIKDAKFANCSSTEEGGGAIHLSFNEKPVKIEIGNLEFDEGSGGEGETAVYVDVADDGLYEELSSTFEKLAENDPSLAQQMTVNTGTKEFTPTSPNTKNTSPPSDNGWVVIVIAIVASIVVVGVVIIITLCVCHHKKTLCFSPTNKTFGSNAIVPIDDTTDEGEHSTPKQQHRDEQEQELSSSVKVFHTGDKTESVELSAVDSRLPGEGDTSDS